MTAPAPGKTVLIVDDDKEIRQIVRTFLGGRGPLRVLEAADGLEAVDLLLREAVDLVITDLHMPRMNGLELASFVRRNPATARTTIVMFTTDRDAYTRRKAMAQGVNFYINKPFNPKDFLRVVGGLLAS